jgi:hypothetical protein
MPFYLNDFVSDSSLLDPEMYQRQLTTFTLLQTMREQYTLTRQLASTSVSHTICNTLPFPRIVENWVSHYSSIYTRVLLTVGADEIWQYLWTCISDVKDAISTVDFPMEPLNDNTWMWRDVHHWSGPGDKTTLWIEDPCSHVIIEREIQHGDGAVCTEMMVRLRWLQHKWQYESKWKSGNFSFM